MGRIEIFVGTVWLWVCWDRVVMGLLVQCGPGFVSTV